MGERLISLKGGAASQLEGMSEETRALMFSVLDSDPRTIPILQVIYFCTNCDNILRWLKSNKITGTRLYDHLRFEAGNSPFTLIKQILSKVEREQKVRILYGKDWKP